MRIGIIGSGVAGSLLAEGLLGSPGHEVTLFERAAAGEHAEAGTGLNLGPNALKALRLHAPARHDALRATSLPWRRWRVDLTDGTPLLDLDLLSVAEEPGARIRWSELYRALRAPVAPLTRQGHALEALEEDAAGRLVPVFVTPGGALVREGGFDLLVGADGRYSRLRALTAGDPVPEHLGLCIWRLLVSDAGDCPFDDYGQWFQGSNRLLAFRVPGDAVYVAGTFRLGGEVPIPEEARTAAHQRALFAPAGAAPCPAVAWMLDRIEADVAGIHWARTQEAPVLRHAAGGRALFLGDAAQAMVPTLGQGATQAIEDGAIAAGILRAGGDAAAVAARRDPRVAFARRLSRAASDTILGEDPVEGTRRKGREPFLAELRRLYTEVPGPGDGAPPARVEAA
ncbi:FAD-dependent monooxygenase [Roseomonas nepalensis]|uniref:FAD-dependent monooxygenase n=1 Tax=Muricoccus nepalensis TaxID=1854500 RepID=A0A502GGQ8_9PROT|nr:NAD(P)/FAD-dependent oxidoreductase [Roseomonas nepalensis]TPG60500.1 FAD-dependent monooxygenase [Roseomonas nepalensis]